MKANEARLQPLIEGTKQFLVPLFQRPYSWEKRHWQTLWKDISDLANDESAKSHFMGAIVTMPAHTVPEGVTKYLLIDGQQRLTTLALLLAAIRDKAKTFPGTLPDKIHELFLTNKYQDGLDTYKLLPTQQDRESFIAVLDSSDGQRVGKIADSYNFFFKMLAKHDKDHLDRLFSLVTTKLFFVSIVLSHDDNAYLIFESLNYKGMPLTQGDLIRNYFLMKIHAKKQEAVFGKYWSPIQDTLGTHLTEYIRHYLTMRHQQFVKKDEIYHLLKTSTATHAEEEVIAYLEDLNTYARYYARFLSPDLEPNQTLSKCLVALRRVEVTTAYPFLLNLWQGMADSKLSVDEVAEILDLLESFMIRRYVCGVPTHGLNKFFPTLYSLAQRHGSLTEGVRDLLSETCPSDSRFRKAFSTREMYGTGERLAKARYILEAIEDGFRHKEPVDYGTLQIEHIMPRTLTAEWKSELGDKWEAVHSQLLDTIGNLTLTGFNPELSNLPFGKKRSLYAASHIEMTRQVAEHDKWVAAEISGRSLVLAQKAVEMWPSVGTPLEELERDDEEVVEGVDVGGEPAMTYGRLVELIGGGSAVQGRTGVFKLTNGKTVLATVSKHYVKKKLYWYGLPPARVAALDEVPCDYVAFGMGMNAVAVVPVATIKGCLPMCWVSKTKEGAIRHYHFTITSGPSCELVYSGDASRIDLTPFVVSRPAS